MANTDRPNGFRIVSQADGSPYNGGFRKYYSVNDNLFKGDLVELDGGGTTSGDGRYPQCDRLNVVTDPILGVVIGWEANPDALGNLYHVASSSYAVHIADIKDLILEAQSDDATMTASDVGLNIEPTITAGTTATGMSNMELDGSSAAVTSTLGFRIVGAVDRADNDATDSTANQRWLVMVNDSQKANQSTGVA